MKKVIKQECFLLFSELTEVWSDTSRKTVARADVTRNNILVTYGAL